MFSSLKKFKKPHPHTTACSTCAATLWSIRKSDCKDLNRSQRGPANHWNNRLLDVPSPFLELLLLDIAVHIMNHGHLTAVHAWKCGSEYCLTHQFLSVQGLFYSTNSAKHLAKFGTIRKGCKLCLAHPPVETFHHFLVPLTRTGSKMQSLQWWLVGVSLRAYLTIMSLSVWHKLLGDTKDQWRRTHGTNTTLARTLILVLGKLSINQLRCITYISFL